jgi:hypothetical protein
VTESTSSLARSSDLEVAPGRVVQTPVLVPSLSSKGFAPVEIEERAVPAPAAYLELLGSALTEALLISSFDIHHGQLSSDGLVANFSASPYARPALLIIDSGWYEARLWADVGEPYEDARIARPWSYDDFESVVESLDPELSAVLVNWDAEHASKGQPSYEEQIARAQEFFEKYSRFCSDFLLKPERMSKWHHFRQLVPHAGRLNAFDIVGVTEKELGDTITDRLVALAYLRRAMDDARVHKPIHVFGGLDPLYAPLYFAAGAEVFDGLSWLRYAYSDGLAVYREAEILMKEQFDKRFPLALGSIQLANLDALRKLTGDLKVFATRGSDWGVLPNGELLRRAYVRMEAALHMGGGRGA